MPMGEGETGREGAKEVLAWPCRSLRSDDLAEHSPPLGHLLVERAERETWLRPFGVVGCVTTGAGEALVTTGFTTGVIVTPTTFLVLASFAALVVMPRASRNGRLREGAGVEHGVRGTGTWHEDAPEHAAWPMEAVP